MTQLFSLLNQVFAHHSNSRDLEQYINAHSPNNAKDVEELTRGYLYQSNGSEEV